MARIGTRAISRTQQRPISFGNKSLRFFNPKCFCFKLNCLFSGVDPLAARPLRFQLTLPLQVQGPSCYFCFLLQKFKTHRNPVRSPLELTFLSPIGSHKKISHNFRFHNPKAPRKNTQESQDFAQESQDFAQERARMRNIFFGHPNRHFFVFCAQPVNLCPSRLLFFWNPTSRPWPPFYYMELPHQLNWAILTHHS